MTLDAAGIQAIAAVGTLMLAMITLIGGWTYWLVRDAERNLRREMNLRLEEMNLRLEETREEMRRMREDMREEMQRFREEMREETARIREDMGRNHREFLALLEGHGHDADGNAVFRRLPDAADS